MNTPLSRVIILAAGQGSRLGALTARTHKSLLPIQGEPLLVRTVRQLVERGFADVTIVVGHLRESIAEAVRPWADSVRLVVNERFASDTNIGSLLLGLEGRVEKTLIVEADVAFDDAAMDEIANAAGSDESIWFTTGPFRSHQLGGILAMGADGRVSDLRYTPRFDPRFSSYRKLLGVLHVGSRQMPAYLALLEQAAARTTAQYFMMPWVENLSALPCTSHDLAHCRTATFNTPDEYRRCCELLEPQPEELHVR